MKNSLKSLSKKADFSDNEKQIYSDSTLSGAKNLNATAAGCKLPYSGPGDPGFAQAGGLLVSWSAGSTISSDYTTAQQFSINSPSGAFRAAWQGDGNFVVYESSGKSRWSSRTAGKGYRLSFQGDRNIVIYNSAGNSVWSSSTNDFCSIVQSNVNVVITNNGYITMNLLPPANPSIVIALGRISGDYFDKFYLR